MVPYSLTNYYIDEKFHPAKSTLGDITSVAYFLGAVSSIFAGPLSRIIGLINTMVFTHIPSSAAVLIFPAPNNLALTAILLLVRAGLNNMDQAPRTAFIAAVVKPEERTAVMGITSMLRTLASTTGPTITGLLAGGGRFWIAFVAAGAFRLAYDIGLYVMFVNMRLHQHEDGAGGGIGGGGQVGIERGQARRTSGGEEMGEAEFELDDLPSSDEEDSGSETVFGDGNGEVK
jgi:MFS family permease